MTSLSNEHVADYYAILGVGDVLEWKHSTKQQQQSEESPWELRHFREVLHLQWSSSRADSEERKDWSILTSQTTNVPFDWSSMSNNPLSSRLPLYLMYQRRQSAEKTKNASPTDIRMDDDVPAIADLQLFYARIHPSLIVGGSPLKLPSTFPSSRGEKGPLLVQSLWKRCTAPQSSEHRSVDVEESHATLPTVPLTSFLELPQGFQEWCVPDAVQHIYADAASGKIERPQLLRHPSSPDCIPVLAVRRQCVDEEQCFHEDAAITDLALEGDGAPDLEEDEDGTFPVLGQTPWIAISSFFKGSATAPSTKLLLKIRRNRPCGLCETPFDTRVLGRFPEQNYNHHPLPEEELPMFCYPTGCTLHRTEYCQVPQPQSYGFVVKNERGDSLHVACVSFMEPLTQAKRRQLDEFSYQRRQTSLSHRNYWERRRRTNPLSFSNQNNTSPKHISTTNSCLVTAFSDMTIFENKTICLVSRYPFWTAFRKFLSHLHIIAGASSDLPLERYISHLLLAVPLPRPGGPAVLVPLPALHGPMILSLPPEKDFPVLDLPYHRLFSCLNVQTIVTLVLGLLALERKVIILSTSPSLVLDVAELLRSLLFPFDLCAPYVPRLTEPFKSSLNFPGAIFVGIHDDGDPHGLAAAVKASYPEESIVVNLDTGEMDCEKGIGDRFELLAQVWNLIPHTPRAALVAELEALCRDVDLVPGQEPLESLVDSAFFVDLVHAVEGHDVNPNHTRKQLDDRGIRDAFLRFFCSLLGGYERFLVVPDADFLVSGDEWFDTQGFLGAVPTEHASYLTSLVSTQLFQSFIQRRTEASDVHCLLFDECLAEYHSSPVPYGRLGGDVEAVRSGDSSQTNMLYSLLVDQSATIVSTGFDHTTILMNRSMDASEADSSFSLNNMSRAVFSVADGSAVHSESVVNSAGELVTVPTQRDLPPGIKYMYCVDGNPCFPHHLHTELFLPREPSSLVITTDLNASNPLLARSERELEEANRRRRMSISRLSGVHQRRCLWQLPKLMGSHFLGSWLLCIPALVSQPNLSHDQQSRYLLRALGALRLLRSKQRIIPDEAAYRALMVACGRTQSDRRVELVKLFGLLRSDGIFPSAVTLGQYTKALAEGYSKRSSDLFSQDNYGIEVTTSNSQEVLFADHRDRNDFDALLDNLDTSLHSLEYQGRRWQQRNTNERGMSADVGDELGIDNKIKRGDSRMWHPVVYSSSFVPNAPRSAPESQNSIRLLAIWSRTRSCSNCSYVPLEEEIQAGWDVFESKNDIPGAVACPRCDAHIVPMLAFREMSIEEALAIDSKSKPQDSFSEPGLDFSEMPPQINPSLENGTMDSQGVGFVAYISPVILREALEQYVEEYGNEILERDRLREFDPEIFINFWWYCARFSLPLPLTVSSDKLHLCAFAAWDRSAAERGCISAAKMIEPLLRSCNDSAPPPPSSADFCQIEMFDDMPLLSYFNLQGFYSCVWDHPDLSKILVALVEACDKRDFRSVLDTAIRCNQRRLDAFNHFQESGGLKNFESTTSSVAHCDCSAYSVELDIYKVLMYLAKYQCTTAFHAFFPATTKPCKGYHFWCSIGTPLPNFDRLFREAVRRTNSSGGSRDKPAPFTHDVSDVALAFRCVFGHLI